VGVLYSDATDLPPILARLNLDPKHWLYLTRHFESRFKSLVGGVFRLKEACTRLGYQRTPGIACCGMYFP